MASRLYALTGALPLLPEALDRASRQCWSIVSEIVRGMVTVVALGGVAAIIPWSCGHDGRLRERIAREGCPFDGDASVRDLPGAREREFHARYCRN